MAGIRVSATLKKRLPTEERDGIEEWLWAKSGGSCFLCEEPINRASDVLEADHDEPDSAGGPTNRANLNLVHATCNRAKRDTPSVDVRPYLRFGAFLRKHGNWLKYEGALPFFNIEPKPAVLTRGNGTATFELPDGRTQQVPVYIDKNSRRAYEYAFIEVPRTALYNDDEVQPRTIKLAQVWSIYLDIQSNPLHEPPSCRVIEEPAKDRVRLVMFDGQHKTIAYWLSGHDRITVKVYLDLKRDEAVELVNSIQAKIKKLPLSPFELAAKMADEWRDRLNRYEEAVGSNHASESGFFKWLPAGERLPAKKAFHEARLQEILDIPTSELLMLRYVQRAGQLKSEDGLITEATFKRRVLERLVCLDPLDEAGDEMEMARAREKQNIKRVLNYLAERFLEPAADPTQISGQELERRRRFLYQAALSYSALLIRSLFRHILVLDDDSRALVAKEPSAEQWNRIEQAINRLAEHPVWTADLGSTDKLKAIDAALSKNQNAEQAFQAVGLKLGYLVGADPLPSDWAK